MHLAFSPSGKMLAVAETALNAMKVQRKSMEEMEEARIQLWDAGTGNKLREFPAHKFCVTSLAFAPGGRTLATTGWSDKGIRFWDAETGKKLFELPCDSPNGVVRFSPDGKTLAWSNL